MVPNLAKALCRAVLPQCGSPLLIPVMLQMTIGGLAGERRLFWLMDELMTLASTPPPRGTHVPMNLIAARRQTMMLSPRLLCLSPDGCICM